MDIGNQRGLRRCQLDMNGDAGRRGDKRGSSDMRKAKVGKTGWLSGWLAIGCP